MKKLVVGAFLTLDGVMQAPGGPEEDTSGGFTHGGWVVPYFDDMMGQAMVEWIRRLDGLVLGRRTYEIFAAHWPRVTTEDPLAEQLNRVPKYVVSRTLKRADWSPSTVLAGDVPEAIRRLKGESGDGELQVHGSGGLIQTLLKNGLIDEFRIWIFPVVLGAGKRLFADGAVPVGLALMETRTSTTGVVLHVYQPAGNPAYGSAAMGEPSGEEFAQRWRNGAAVE
jgi:dihydrofolate reductase